MAADALPMQGASAMMASSNGIIFRVTGHLCGEFTGPRWIPAQRPVTRRLDVFFDLHQIKRLGKQWWGWWCETPSYPLWRHRNEQHPRYLICRKSGKQFTTLGLGDAVWHRGVWSSLVYTVACHLFGAKPQPELTLPIMSNWTIRRPPLLLIKINQTFKNIYKMVFKTNTYGFPLEHLTKPGKKTLGVNHF